jgi:hypothetical protein
MSSRTKLLRTFENGTKYKKNWEPLLQATNQFYHLRKQSITKVVHDADIHWVPQQVLLDTPVILNKNIIF